MRPSLIVISVFAVLTFAEKPSGPLIDLPDPAVSYHGVVREDETTVDVSPEIRIVDGTGPVCSYLLHGSRLEDNTEVPFEVIVENRETGKARIVLRAGESLDCEREKTYNLILSARRCNDSTLSKSAFLSIEVSDVNEFAPEFPKSWYELTVDEGKVYDELLKLEATDRDCSKKYSEICKYAITNHATPFVIDSTGVLRNTAPLSRQVAKSHLITVEAYDCGMRASREIVITVNVVASCSIGWQNIPERVEFIPGTEDIVLSPQAKMDLCDLQCEIESLNVSVTLHSDSTKGCDRDTSSMRTQRKVCHLSEEMFELLPSTKDIKVENEIESEQIEDEVFLFDEAAKNALTVESEKIKHLPDRFTIMFWMKHEENKHASGKESIICVSDEKRMNRHHFAIFVRNCKIEMLFRREASTVQNDLNAFKPAEWRWLLPEVCDGGWHQYAISVDFPQVSMIVDGKRVQQNVPEVLDDMPMREEPKMKTRTVIGACWQGKSGRMAQFFNGELAGFTYLPGKTEKQDSIECLHRCRESLEFDALDQLKPGMEAVFNSEMSKVFLKAKDPAGLGSLMQRVKYLNSKIEPTPGHRLIEIETYLKCEHMAKPILLPQVREVVLVQKVPDPELVLTGAQQTKGTVTAVRGGVTVFSDVKLSIRELKNARKERGVESCNIAANPPLNKSVEYLSVPAALLTNNGLDFDQTETVLQLKGEESAEKYEQVLEHIHYYNIRSSADLLKSRKFLLSCVMLRGRVRSNVLGVQLIISRDPTPPEENPAALAHVQIKQNDIEHAGLAKKHVQEVPMPLIHDSFEAQGEAGSAVAVVVVVCVGFLVLLVGVGVWRVRSASGSVGRGRRTSTKEGDLAWDDAGMNIVVNPLEELNSVKTETQKGSNSSESESDGDCDSLRDDEDYSEDEESVLPHTVAASGKKGRLEWDDSTLQNGSPGRASAVARSQTYRV